MVTVFSHRGIPDGKKQQKNICGDRKTPGQLSRANQDNIIDRIPRYDLKEKEILKTFEKYFAGDQDIIYARNQGHHPTYVVSMDELWRDNIEGIKHVHIADFLLMEIKSTLLMCI